MYHVDYYLGDQAGILVLKTTEEVAEQIQKWGQGTYEEAFLTVYQEHPWVRILSIDLTEDELDIENIRQYIDLRIKLNEWDNNRSNPSKTFPEMHIKRQVKYGSLFPYHTYAPMTIEEVTEVPLESIYGDNWAFDRLQDRGRYPAYNKLRDLLNGYTGLDNHYWASSGRTIPPVTLYHIGDGYFFSEGNHRFYLSSLLNRPTLLAEVYHYDYEAFLNDSYLLKGRYIVYKGQAHYVDEQEARNYDLVKSHLRQYGTLNTQLLLASMK